MTGYSVTNTTLSWGTGWCDCSDCNPYSNPWWLEQARAERAWERRWFTLRHLKELYRWTWLPLLLVFRRFDFRSMPRWRARRWKAKT